MGKPSPLEPLRSHPVYSIACQLEEFLGVEKDLIQLTTFLSLAAGHMAMPINLDIQTDHLNVDLHLANAIRDLCCDRTTHVDTHREFRALERADFEVAALSNNSQKTDGPTNLAVVLVRGSHHTLHRELSEYAAHLPRPDMGSPSLWRVLVPLYTSRGEILEKPLVAVLDLLCDDDRLTVVEFKTSGKKYGEADVDRSLQSVAISTVSG